MRGRGSHERLTASRGLAHTVLHVRLIEPTRQQEGKRRRLLSTCTRLECKNKSDYA
jgi:hypothetical protein